MGMHTARSLLAMCSHVCCLNRSNMNICPKGTALVCMQTKPKAIKSVICMYWRYAYMVNTGVSPVHATWKLHMSERVVHTSITQYLHLQWMKKKSVSHHGYLLAIGMERSNIKSPGNPGGRFSLSELMQTGMSLTEDIFVLKCYIIRNGRGI